ncbi:hypothetical protein NKR23_g7915 [Pleurostoma richardsiae]|uniref:Poly [ADP-ribose] polymerase n=1 Tax=Pleurostoma richardsiae TaxID=41990 RepID=A0AA38RGQ7_9PEZI|nr:hypothetical protein NKR23_g7915 [Pleurostoma richardsiae]
MPPKKASKKAAAAAKPPLDGCCVVFSGTFRGTSQSALQGQTTAMGGSTASTVTKEATHLVTTQADYDKPSAKVKTAKDLGIHIVDVQWLQDCVSTSSREAEGRYSFGTINGTTPNGGAAANSASASSAPPAKRPGAAQAPAATNGAKKRQAPPTASPDQADRDGDGGDKAQAKKKKKLAEADQDEERQFGEGQIAKSRDVRIPLDEGCPLISYSVYIDPDDGVIWDASLNQTNATANNNKFYRVQLLVNGPGTHYQTWTRWGRVGDRGQTATLGNGSLEDAKRHFQKKFKDKSGLKWEDRTATPVKGKYTFIERSYNDDSDDDGDDENDSARAGGKSKDGGQEPLKCTLSPPVQRLMELIFNQQYFANNMSDLNYDTKKMPLGKLSRATILKGFQTLKDLSNLLTDPGLAAEYNAPFPVAKENLSNAYFSLIPHAFGRNRPPIISDQQMVKKEIELLENLADMKDAADIMKADLVTKETMHPLDRHYRGLGMEEMTPLDHESSEYKFLEEYLKETRGHTHVANYSIHSIFRIERQGEHDRFESAFGHQPKDRRLLWHGSRVTNFGGILSQGLRIAPPEAPVTGYMFDKGIYLADMSSKSANYCYSGISGGNALLLLCEAELGSPVQELLNAQYDAGATARAQNLWSTWGKGRTGPKAWKDASCVHPSLRGVMMPDIAKAKPGDTNCLGATLQYNEYICYDVAQVRLRYLFQVKM